ncbi:MAG: hypothetical protein ACJ74Y_17930 [Bryobacteraceae bacterium]
MSVLSPSRTLTAIAGLLLAFATSGRADRPEDIRAQLVYVASALSGGNPSDALGPIDKSFKDYGKLRDYFVALTQAYQVASEVDITDEDDRETETVLEVTWRLTLTEPATNVSSQRSADIKLKLVQKDGKWKIVDLSPIELFNPQRVEP